MSGSGDDLGYTPRTKEIVDARRETQKVSSELYNIIGLRGKVSEPGPGVALCGDRDPQKFYVIHHPWNLTNVPVEDMREAMERLKRDLPKHGWKIKKYGPDTSPAKTLTLIADKQKQPFSVNIALHDRSKRKDAGAPKSLIYVDLVSACFQVPDGKIVDEY